MVHTWLPDLTIEYAQDNLTFSERCGVLIRERRMFGQCPRVRSITQPEVHGELMVSGDSMTQERADASNSTGSTAGSIEGVVVPIFAPNTALHPTRRVGAILKNCGMLEAVPVYQRRPAHRRAR